MGDDMATDVDDDVIMEAHLLTGQNEHIPFFQGEGSPFISRPK